MITTHILMAFNLAAGFMFGSHSARSHCDSVDGPAGEQVVETGKLSKLKAVLDDEIGRALNAE